MKKVFLLMLVLAGLSLMVVSCGPDKAAMLRQLEALEAANRADSLMQNDSLAEALADYFDRHGSLNERVLSHYLLGRTYYDQGEAPMALQCYHDAIGCADTTADDCDYTLVSRVYGQMAQVFYEQGLYRQQLSHEQLAVRYAWQGGDTLAALMSYEHESFAYKHLGMQDSAISVIENVASKYIQYGYPSDAVISLGTIISTLIERGKYQQAKSYMDDYEGKSGYFDAQGNITPGREIYYKVKGLYYLYNNMLDSAEYYFRKELHDGKDFNNQNAAAIGLTLLYQRKNCPDSIAKYSVYAYAMSDSIYAKRTTKEIKRIQAMYDYSRHQAAAIQEREKATRANGQLLLSLIALLTVALIASWLYIARKQAIGNLRQTASELNTVRDELVELQLNSSVNELSVREKEKRIKQLEQKLGRYGRLVYFGTAKAENDLLLSPNYQKIKALAYKGQKLQECDWGIIHQLTEEYFPGYADFLDSNLRQGSIEYQVCLLLRLHFKAGEIANMLSVTPPYISKVSTTVLANLFGKRGSSKDLSKELDKIN